MSLPVRPNTPPPPERARQARIENVENRRVEIATRPFYLAAPDVVDSLQWIQSGRGHVLVDASITDETPIHDIRPAVLTVIGQVDSDHLYLRSDTWKPSKYTSTMADLKLKLKFGSPLGFGAGVSTDFNNACKALAALEKKGITVTAPETTSVIHPSTTVLGASLIQLRHVLFSPKDVEEEVVPADAVPDPLPDAEALATYTIENWPVTTAEARASIASIKDTHVLNVPPFYDMHWHLLSPAQYQRSLEGAVAQIRFTLNHHLIGKAEDNDLKNVFSADVHDVIVIYGAPPRMITPRRHRIWAVHPSSPTKKRKTSH